MKTPAKLGGFVVALAVVLAIAFGVGDAVGPINQNSPDSDGHDMTEASGHAESGHGASSGHGDHGGAADSQPAGLMISEHGYTLALGSRIVAAGRTKVQFRVLGPDGRPVTDYKPTHDKDLHFIAARRDMTGFQHVHPTIDQSGTWTTELELTPGVWRFFTDFQPAGHGQTMTLGSDVSVAGNYEPQPLPPVNQTAQVGDYTVTLDGRLTPGQASELTLTVARGGQPVTDLQPYLAAYGHLVALRAGDLAYLHVHPEGEPGDGSTKPGPDVTFFATAPTAGPYRLYLDFKHDGVVRTAEFTVNATAADPGTEPGGPTQPAPASTSAAPSTPESAGPGGHSGHDHH